jgi:Do/DeqQ family serine protease
MSLKKLFYSKKFLYINLVLVGIIIGFSTTMLVFSLQNRSLSDNLVHKTDTVVSSRTVSSIENLNTIGNSFREVASRVLPAVVQVDVIEIQEQSLQPKGERFPFLPWNFGPNGPDVPDDEQFEFRNEGLGSGVIVKKEKNIVFVLTNNHVIGNADEVKVTLYDQREFSAEIIGKDIRKDLALISFTSRDGSIPTATFGDSDSVSVGDWVLAIGNPFGYESTVTAGIVSAIGRRGPIDNINDFIQTDAAINQGNSGGALVNIKGELVGINTWITTPTGGNIGIGFAIPVNNVRKAIDDFIKLGEIEYGWLGVSISDVLPEIAEQMEVSNKEGAFIYHVFTGSPADRAGIQPGDFVTAINGRKITDAAMLVRVVGDLPPSKTASFTVIRFGETEVINVVIGRRTDAHTIASKNKYLWPGLSVVPLTTSLRKELELWQAQQGVLVREVEPETKLQIAGIKLGDVITRINETEIISVSDFYRIINDDRTDELRFYFLREGNEYNIAVTQ